MTNCIRCNDTRILMYGPHEAICSNCIGATYAGIGSRETPENVLRDMTTIAMQLAIKGFVLRSGRAKGADSAFEKGVNLIDPKRKVIRVATGDKSALNHAALFHPQWGACNDRAKALHARNSLIMLGDWLDNPVRFVVCWTAGGAIVGGTGQALRIAAAYNIPVFNLAVQPVTDLWEWLSVQ